jgi:ATP-dependent exoDNAse (exonuclease V) beta subunit
MKTLDLEDAGARQLAVDPRRSCIVRAPAGSGKTELLIRRYLALLAAVERPDEILAITFTRKAAAEMVQRVLSALADCANELPADAPPHSRATRLLAQAVLARDREFGWHLLHHPDQLQIQTIDSFNAALVRRMPWLTRLGGLPQINERPQQLYREAVRQTVHLHHDNSAMNEVVQLLLLHLDNRGDILEEMLIKLLASRDQWLRHLLGDVGQQRQQLEAALGQVVTGYLAQLLDGVDPYMQQELVALGSYAAENCAKPERALCVLVQFTTSGCPFPTASPDDLDLWRGLADLLLTAEGNWRKSCDKNCGFPPGKNNIAAQMKQRMLALLAQLRTAEVDPRLWQVVRRLPAPQYAQQQWEILQGLVTILPQLVAQLWLVFSRSSQVDFVEIALRARQALIDSGNPTEQLLSLDQRLQHILVDEFQDTSWLQFDLLTTLTSGWQSGDGHSLFIVGDPMQSIYRFREAEVGLFLQASTDGVADFALDSLQLRANFRSQRGIVEWINRYFSTIFPTSEDAGSGAVAYSPAQAVLPPDDGSAVQVFAQHTLDVAVEAEQVCSVVQQILQHSAEQTVAILVRSRSHLVAILAQLSAANIHYQAQNVDLLTQRIAVSDVVALTKAIFHPADHLSWLTVLRAPWCGLLLADMLVFKFEAGVTMLEMLHDESRLKQLSADGYKRVLAITPSLNAAVQKRGRCCVRKLIEELWGALRGQECYTPAELDDVEQAFALLEKLDHGGDVLSFEHLDFELQGLFSAGDVQVDCRVQVMTIHKAKGLEFDHVILPGLGRKPRGEDKTLLRWQEHADYGLLLAPVAARGENGDDSIYALIGQIDKNKSDNEVARLLYVAVTRAQHNLYLFGHAALNKDDEAQPAKGSLLEKLWPAVAASFAASANTNNPEVGAEEQQDMPRLNAPLLRRLAAPLVVDGRHRVDDEVGSGDIVAPVAEVPVAGSRIPGVIGTLTHVWLEYLTHHRSAWELEKLERLRVKIEAQLLSAGIDRDQVGEYGAVIVQMLQRTVTSKRGQWILADHPYGYCEYHLSGIIDLADNDRSGVRNYVIDRTFVADGIRWIIDYKTSAPAAQQSCADFYVQQSQYYAAQLEAYAQFMAYADPVHPCRCALYFPVFDGWYELPHDLVHRQPIQPELF